MAYCVFPQLRVTSQSLNKKYNWSLVSMKLTVPVSSITHRHRSVHAQPNITICDCGAPMQVCLFTDLLMYYDGTNQ